MWLLIIATVAGLAWTSPADAEDVPPSVPPPKLDCRYLAAEHPEAGQSAGASRSARFPQDDVFRPLLADPKQPQFQATYQRMTLRQSNNDLNAAFVGFGETFGLWTRRQEQGCNGIQIGAFGAVFSQFNADARSKDLINSDFQLGFPV